LVNAIGNVGGFIGAEPDRVPEDDDRSRQRAFYTLAAMALVAAAIIASMRRVPALARRSAVGTRPVEPVVVAAVPGWMLRGCRVSPRVLAAGSAAVSEECVGDRLSDAAPG
jgi:hypothetical protein